MRLFVAVNLPAEERRRAWAAAAPLRARHWPVRWVAEDALHLTLRFLGEVDGTFLDPLTEALESAVAGIRILSLIYAGVGFFPDRNRPRILWVGIEESSGTRGSPQRISIPLPRPMLTFTTSCKAMV